MNKLEFVASNTERKVARDLSEELGVLHNSIRRGNGNFVGYLAEVILAGRTKLRREQSYDYDLVGNKMTYDVKTKQRKVPAQEDYSASIAAYNPNQDCDAYIFASAYNRNDVWTVEYLGWMPKEEYFEKATFHKKGDLDPNDFTGRGWRFNADCYNLLYRDLYPIEELDIF